MEDGQNTGKTKIGLSRSEKKQRGLLIQSNKMRKQWRNSRKSKTVWISL